MSGSREDSRRRWVRQHWREVRYDEGIDTATEHGSTRVMGGLDKSPLSLAKHGPKKFFPLASMQGRKELAMGAEFRGNFSVVYVDRWLIYTQSSIRIHFI